MDYIDIYCERLVTGLWAEPFNALTNLSFFIAAWASWRSANRYQTLSIGMWLLISLIAAIGIGSTLFHTFATSWANLADVLPIFLFQICYLWLYCKQIVGMKTRYASGFLAAFIISAYFADELPKVLNGSLSYVPALFVLLGLGIYHYQAQKQGKFLLLAASAIFFLSLFFRTLDQIICPYFPLGTHFLWHILNGALLYLAMQGFILNRSAVTKAS